MVIGITVYSAVLNLMIVLDAVTGLRTYRTGCSSYILKWLYSYHRHWIIIYSHSTTSLQFHLCSWVPSFTHLPLFILQGGSVGTAQYTGRIRGRRGSGWWCSRCVTYQLAFSKWWVLYVCVRDFLSIYAFLISGVTNPLSALLKKPGFSYWIAK